jgi:hypothetical protein
LTEPSAAVQKFAEFKVLQDFGKTEVLVLIKLEDGCSIFSEERRAPSPFA